MDNLTRAVEETLRALSQDKQKIGSVDAVTSEEDAVRRLVQVQNIIKTTMRDAESMINQCQSEILEDPSKESDYVLSEKFPEQTENLKILVNELEKQEKEMRELLNDEEKQLFSKARIYKYQGKIIKMLQWLQDIGIPSVSSTIEGASCLSEAEVTKNHFETGFHNVAKNFIWLSEKVNEKSKEILENYYDPQCENLKNLHLDLKELTAEFKNLVERKHQIIINVYSFYLCLQQFIKWWTDFCGCLTLSASLFYKEGSACYRLSDAGISLLQQYLLTYPVPGWSDLKRLAHFFSNESTGNIACEAKLVLQRIRLLEKLTQPNPVLSTKEADQVLKLIQYTNPRPTRIKVPDPGLRPPPYKYAVYNKYGKSSLNILKHYVPNKISSTYQSEGQTFQNTKLKNQLLGNTDMVSKLYKSIDQVDSLSVQNDRKSSKEVHEQQLSKSTNSTEYSDSEKDAIFLRKAIENEIIINSLYQKLKQNSSKPNKVKKIPNLLLSEDIDLQLTQANIDSVVNSGLPSEEKLDLMAAMCECDNPVDYELPPELNNDTKRGKGMAEYKKQFNYVQNGPLTMPMDHVSNSHDTINSTNQDYVYTLDNCKLKSKIKSAGSPDMTTKEKEESLLDQGVYLVDMEDDEAFIDAEVEIINMPNLKKSSHPAVVDIQGIDIEQWLEANDKLVKDSTEAYLLKLQDIQEKSKQEERELELEEKRLRQMKLEEIGVEQDLISESLCITAAQLENVSFEKKDSTKCIKPENGDISLPCETERGVNLDELYTSKCTLKLQHTEQNNSTVDEGNIKHIDDTFKPEKIGSDAAIQLVKPVPVSLAVTSRITSGNLQETVEEDIDNNFSNTDIAFKPIDILEVR